MECLIFLFEITIKSKLIKKLNLNKLNTNQKIHLTIDQSNNKIKEFIFQVSNKERVLLTRNEKDKTIQAANIVLSEGFFIFFSI